MTDIKEYRMGECVLAANDKPDVIFCVFRMLAPRNKCLYGSIPAAFFKELDQHGHKINSHCFLGSNDGKVFDPMFKMFDVTIGDYLKEICKHIELGSDQRYVLFDIQELLECNKFSNRSKFEASNHLLLGSFLIDMVNNTIESIE